jgi:hypothetical protein
MKHGLKIRGIHNQKSINRRKHCGDLSAGETQILKLLVKKVQAVRYKPEGRGFDSRLGLETFH